MNLSRPSLVIGSRGSELALWQSHHIKSRLENIHSDLKITIEIIKTTGDKILDSPLSLIGGKGVFTVELERALLRKEIDIAVHSLKDLPTELGKNLVIAAIPERANAEDAFLSNNENTNVFELREGAKIATGSLRRKAQILSRRPDYEIIDIRGNVPTRIKKLRESDWDGMILAAAGLERLGLGGEMIHYISTEDMLPAPGQGALAIEARQDDLDIAKLLSSLEDPHTRLSTSTEREILHELGGGCQLPLGAFVDKGVDGYIINACIAYPNGNGMLRSRLRSDETSLMMNAKRIADDLLERGGEEIIAHLTDSEKAEKIH